MLRFVLYLALMPTAALAASPSQATSATSVTAPVLGTVTINASVLAGGKPLPRGTYQVRLGNDQAAATDAQRRVELVANGTVVARELAEVLRDSDRPAIGDSARPSTDGVRVEMLKGEEFLRISAKRDGVRYLIHLPIAR